MDFDTFYRTESPAMVALARAICGDHRYAEDVAQEAMTSAHRNWAKVCTYQKPGAWLRRVTINLAISRRRRLQRELRFIRRVASEPTVSETMIESPDEEVWQAVLGLPPRQRAAVALFYLHDLPTSEIAEAMDCSVSTATSHLNQARRKLAETLGEDFR